MALELLVSTLRRMAAAALLLPIGLAAGALPAAAEPADDLAPPDHRASGADAARHTVFVSPKGKDFWSGRLAEPNAAGTDGPLATLQAARDRMRHDGQIRTALVRGGDYYLTESIRLTEEDSGTTFRAYPGETPTLHGGTPVTGWTAGAGGVWTARVPYYHLGTSGIGDLFVDGVRQIHARFPKYDRDDPIHGGWLFARAVPDAAAGDHRIGFEPGSIPRYARRAALKISIFTAEGWRSDVYRVAAIDHERGVISFESDDDDAPGPGSRYFLFDAAEMLAAPGEWSYDPVTGTLSYIPAEAGFTGAGVTIGTLSSVIEIAGNVIEDTAAPASGITISGFTIADTTPYAADGSVSRYYGGGVRGALRIVNAADLTVADNRIRNAGIGIFVAQGSRITIARNEIAHTAADGIVLSAGSDHTVVTGNRLHDIGTLYKNGSGIWFTEVSDTRIAGNIIEDTAAHGIGGGSYTGDAGAFRTVIEHNRIAGANRENSDGGGIYLIGRGQRPSGDQVRHNVITGTGATGTDRNGRFLKPSQLTSSAVYLDDYASGVTVYCNRMEGGRYGLFLHGGWDNSIRRNLLLDSPIGLLWQVASNGGDRTHPAVNNLFEDNLVVARDAPQLIIDEDIENSPTRAASVPGAAMAVFGRNRYRPASPLGHLVPLYHRGTVDGGDAVPSNDGGDAVPSNGAMWEDGAIVMTVPHGAVPAPDGTARITIDAFGTPAGGVNAHFRLLLDGRAIGESTVDETVRAYSFEAAWSAGRPHSLAVVFDNDAAIGDEDRNLYVEGVRINGIRIPHRAETTYGSLEDWIGRGFDRDATVAGLAARQDGGGAVAPATASPDGERDGIAEWERACGTGIPGSPEAAEAP